MNAQISLDLIFAILFGFVAISSVFMISGEITEMQTQSGVRQQLEDIGLGLSQVISTSAILEDASSATIAFTVPEILVLGEMKPQSCDIIINPDTNTMTLEYDIIDIEAGTIETVTVTKQFANPGDMTIDPRDPDKLECGKTLTITKI